MMTATTAITKVRVFVIIYLFFIDNRRRRPRRLRRHIISSTKHTHKLFCCCVVGWVYRMLFWKIVDDNDDDDGIDVWKMSIQWYYGNEIWFSNYTRNSVCVWCIVWEIWWDSKSKYSANVAWFTPIVIHSSRARQCQRWAVASGV